MKTIGEILSLSVEYLQRHEIQNHKRIAADLLAHVLGVSRVQIYMDFGRPLGEDELSKYRQGLRRLIKKEPLQYILGEIEFFGCKIKVDASVLIPRQETEILVDMISKELEKEDLTDKILWDVCCGSGCMGISLKKRFPELSVVLSDISEDALSVARENIKINDVDVSVLNGDLLEPFSEKKAHFIVCNPPYVTEKEYDNLGSEVRDYEPRGALVAGKTGMEYYEKLARDIKKYLYGDSRVWFEIGQNQGQKICDLFDMQGVLLQDWSGNDRFFCLK